MMDTLPLVRQVDVVPASWQLGSASAAGAEKPATTTKLTTSRVVLRGRPISGNPI